MKVGDLVWSLAYEPCGIKIVKRLAIIVKVENRHLMNPYIIKLVACGRQGRTSRKYLEPMGRD